MYECFFVCFLFDPILKAWYLSRAEIRIFLVGFLEELKQRKIVSDISDL